MRARLATLLALSITSPGIALADEVVAFGDSWAEGGAPTLAMSLAQAGHAFLVSNRGIGGSTAQQWAVTTPNGILDAVNANPNARWLWLSIGGNDAIELYQAGQQSQIATRNEANIRTILDRLFMARPDIRVVMFGYDYTNFVQSPACVSQAEDFFYAGVTQAQINQIFLAGVGDVMQTVAASYPNVHYVPVWGAMQRGAGMASNASQPSPASMMTDCFHPNAQGYQAMFAELVASYWGAPPPAVTLSPAPSRACVGDTLTFGAQATNAESYLWRVAGAPVPGQSSAQISFGASGSVEVEVVVGNRAWSASARRTVQVSSCLDAGVPDMGLDAGGGPDAEADGGVHPDAAALDALSPDASILDAATPALDAGFDPVDASWPAPADGGLEKPRINQEWSLGGGCTATHGVRRGAPLIALLAAISAFARPSSRRRPLRRPRP